MFKWISKNMFLIEKNNHLVFKFHIHGWWRPYRWNQSTNNICLNRWSTKNILVMSSIFWWIIFNLPIKQSQVSYNCGILHLQYFYCICCNVHVFWAVRICFGSSWLAITLKQIFKGKLRIFYRILWIYCGWCKQLFWI